MLDINLDVICFLEIILELIKSSYKSIYVEAISWTIINQAHPWLRSTHNSSMGGGEEREREEKQ
jgi:hypothetical protein